MPNPESRATLAEMTREMLELYTLAAAARTRRPAGPDDLSETEFLTLEALAESQPITIGEIQKHVGVVPAQMSRIMRALERNGGKGYVDCSINANDRRRVDVSMTADGAIALDRYRAARLESMHQILADLSVDDRLHFMRILRQIRDSLRARLGGSPSE